MGEIKYSDKVMEHFIRPRNFGEMKNPDAVGVVGNIICGDVMKIYLKIFRNKKNQEFIKDIKFQTMGCAAAIATSSMITELVRGKTIAEAKKITNKDVAYSLQGLPAIKMHCSNLASDCLKKAIENWEKGN
jgi:nitrogen fixation NifU-like protein